MALAPLPPPPAKRYSRSRHSSTESDYQHIAIDREALETAYQQSLLAPSSSSTNLTSSGNSSQSHVGSVPGLSGTRNSPFPGSESLIPFGHPSGSTINRVAPYPALASPSIPQRPTIPYEQSFAPSSSSSQTFPSTQRTFSAMEIDSPGITSSSDFHSSPRGRGKARALPDLPTDVPPPELPEWEPDYKPIIPDSLTAPSVADAYARLSAPPPNLPPRRNQPFRQAAQNHAYSPRSQSRNGGPSALVSGNRGDVPMASPSTSRSGGSFLNQSSGHLSTPTTVEPMNIDGSSNLGPADPRIPRPQAEKEVSLHATGTTPIWSTHYIDPSLSTSLVMLPPPVAAINAAVASASSGKRKRFSTTGALDGMARELKEWIVPPDARFVVENGGVELSLAVIDSGGEGWGRDKGRKKARVEVVSRGGGIRCDVTEIDSNRQIDLRVDTKSGDVLILLPHNFHGPIHITSPARPPTFLPILTPQLKTPITPYPALTTTFVNPLPLQLDPAHSEPVDNAIATGIHRLVPASREHGRNLDMARDGNDIGSRGEQSKISVQSSRGKVVVGYRETLDEQTAKGMGLKVGIERNIGKEKMGKKRWWRS